MGITGINRVDDRMTDVYLYKNIFIYLKIIFIEFVYLVSLIFNKYYYFSINTNNLPHLSDLIVFYICCHWYIVFGYFLKANAAVSIAQLYLYIFTQPKKYLNLSKRNRMFVVDQKRFSERVTKPTLKILVLNWRWFEHQRASPGINSVGYDNTKGLARCLAR